MDSNFPQDLLDLKNRIDHWRLTRRFVREALPAELREAIIQILSVIPSSRSNRLSNLIHIVSGLRLLIQHQHSEYFHLPLLCDL